MKLKLILRSLLFIYSIQLIFTSCDPCSCSPAETYRIDYNSISIKAWDTSGFVDTEIENVNDGVSKNAFGISIYTEYEEIKIAQNNSKLNLNTLGFAQANAFSCDCVPNTYLREDPVSSIEIWIQETSESKTIDVTDAFSIAQYDGTKLPVKDFFLNKEDWQNIFRIELSKSEKIPTTARFTINLYLQSGIQLSDTTHLINFQE